MNKVKKKLNKVDQCWTKLIEVEEILLGKSEQRKQCWGLEKLSKAKMSKIVEINKIDQINLIDQIFQIDQIE